MQCPACEKQLAPETFESITVQLCQDGCEGFFVEQAVLKKLEDPHCQIGQAVVDAEKRGPRKDVDNSQPRSCPKCNVPMMRHYVSVQQGIQVDECAGCGGVWLDNGELEKIRSLFSGEDRHKGEAHVATKFDAQLSHLRQKETATSMNKIVQLEKVVHNFFKR